MKVFEIKRLIEPRRCLGIEITRDKSGISIAQGIYVRVVLKRFDMSQCNPVSMPMAPGVRLTKQDVWKEEHGKKPPYRELIGCLLYLARATRPYISHTVSSLSQFNDSFGKSHWEAAKRVLRYLKGTSDIGIKYSVINRELSGYVDPDYAGCTDDRKSSTGFVFLLNRGPVSWESRKVNGGGIGDRGRVRGAERGFKEGRTPSALPGGTRRITPRKYNYIQ